MQNGVLIFIGWLDGIIDSLTVVQGTLASFVVSRILWESCTVKEGASPSHTFGVLGARAKLTPPLGCQKWHPYVDVTSTLLLVSPGHVFCGVIKAHFLGVRSLCEIDTPFGVSKNDTPMWTSLITPTCVTMTHFGGVDIPCEMTRPLMCCNDTRGGCRIFEMVELWVSTQTVRKIYDGHAH